MHMMIRIPIALSLALVLASAARLPAQGRGSNDTVYIRGATPPAWGAAVTLTPLFSIGKVDGPPEYAFGSIGAIAIDRSNRFYLFDENDRQIRLYDASGKFVRPIGRRGEGPGEYRVVAGMDVVDDTVLAIYDPGSAAVHLLQPDGKYVRSIRDSRFTTWDDHWFATDAANHLYVRATIMKPGVGMEMMETPGMTLGQQFLVYGTNGGIADSLRVPPTPTERAHAFYIITADGGSPNFVNESYAAPCLGGLVYGANDAYRFGMVPLRGPVRIVERPWAPVPVSDAERANWQQYADFFGERDKQRASGRLDPYVIPRTKPAFRDLFCDRNGRVWVSLYAAAEHRDLPPRPAGDTRPQLVWLQRATYDVYDDAGTYLGRVTLPHRSQVLAAQGDRVWVLSKDADDVESITVYRMSGAARSRP
jgi:6-bladed beta-propeller